MMGSETVERGYSTVSETSAGAPQSLDEPIPNEKPSRWNFGDWRKYTGVKFSTEFDSEDWIVKNKMSAKVFDGFAKIKAIVERSKDGNIRCPQVGFISKHLSVLFHTASCNATFSSTSTLAEDLTIKLNGDVKLSSPWHSQIKMATRYLSLLYHPDGCNLLVTCSRAITQHVGIEALLDAKAQQGEIKMFTNFQDSKYEADISCGIPAMGLSRSVVRFPIGEVYLRGKHDDNGKGLSISGFIEKKFINGSSMAEYANDKLNLRYRFKDEQMTFRPTLSFPSKELSFIFARKFNTMNKLNMEYNFTSTAWDTVYKFKPNDDIKIKTGYSSSSSIGWISAWLGREDSGAKNAPGKTKIRLMLQVPSYQVRSSVILIKFKRRWDL